jgi:hypothetical protein
MSRLNFLGDVGSSPHLTAERMGALLGVKPATMQTKSRLILGTWKTGHFDPEFSRAEVLDAFGGALGPVTEIWVSLLSAD